MTELLAELLERCQTGDPDAVAALVRRFQSWTIDLATALLSDPHLAEDAVQAAFIRALDRLPDLRNASAFPGWLRQIVRTECYRISRRRAEQGACLDRDVPTDQPSPVQQAETRERCRLIRQALATLPPAARQAAELFYLDQLDCAEVAERLAVPAGTVKRRLHDARIRLRQILVDYGHSRPENKPPSDQIPL